LRKGFQALEKEVCEPGFCVLCGACSGFCDRLTLDYGAGMPRLKGACVETCSSCYDHCPARASFNPVHLFGGAARDELLGCYTEAKAVRARDEELRQGAQDGGAVTAILSAIFERGKIDAAIVVERDRRWNPVPKIARSAEELLTTKGSKYSPSPNLEKLGESFRDESIRSVAIVDVGCHIRGVRSLEYGLLYNAGFSPYSELKIYALGLFCAESFHPTALFKAIRRRPEEVEGMRIRKGRLSIVAKGCESISLKALENLCLHSCSRCADYTAELADLSIGSIGTPEGYSTVIVRDLMGWGMLRDAVQRGYVEAEAGLVDLEAVKKAVSKKRARALQART